MSLDGCFGYTLAFGEELLNQQTRNIVKALLHGLTGAGLFRRLDYPGSPKEFVDSRSLKEILASGEFEGACDEIDFVWERKDCGQD